MIADIVRQLSDHVSLEYSDSNYRFALHGTATVNRNGARPRLEYSGGILVTDKSSTPSTGYDLFTFMQGDLAPKSKVAGRDVVQEVREALIDIAQGSHYALTVDAQGNIKISTEQISTFIDMEVDRIKLNTGRPFSESYRL